MEKQRNLIYPSTSPTPTSIYSAKNNRLIKAVDNAAGEIMGHSWFAFRNFDLEDVANLEDTTIPLTGLQYVPEELTLEVSIPTTIESIKGAGTWKNFTNSDIEDPIKHLKILTGGDLMLF